MRGLLHGAFELHEWLLRKAQLWRVRVLGSGVLQLQRALMLATALLVLAAQTWETDGPALAEVRSMPPPPQEPRYVVAHTPSTPVERYRAGSTSMMAGAAGSYGSSAGLGGAFANGAAQGFVGLGSERSSRS